MLDSVINMFMTGVSSAFSWFTDILSAIPGSMKFILTFFTMYLICRFVLGPVIGNFFAFSTSDTVKKETHDTKAERPINNLD